MATLTRIKMFHEGQFEGRKVRLPVFLGRRPEEQVDDDLRAFYNKLLAAIDSPVFRDGDWRLCERSGWPDNATFLNLVTWCWTKDDERYLVIVNLSDGSVQARVQAPWQEGAGKTWRLCDPLSGAEYDRSGDEMLSPGLYVELAAWGYNLFRCRLEG